MYNKVWVLPFEPQPASTVRVSVTASTGAIRVPFASTDPYLTGGAPYSQGRRDLCVRVVNPSARNVRMDFVATATAGTATSGFLVLAGRTEVFSTVKGRYVVATATGSVTLELTPGEGIGS